jgi:hypothetical protein
MQRLLNSERSMLSRLAKKKKKIMCNNLRRAKDGEGVEA